MHYINIHNKSNHDQTFEVHGYNNNKNITVARGTTAVIQADDHQSGAIIALHDGHEGEQAEISKDGFGSNDFFDLSNIVGAGGNMTIQQVGEPTTRKGDPTFMQDLNRAWHKADQRTKDGLKNCIHLDNSGNVVRMDSPKTFANLEKFVRTFADGRTYIGIGAWGGYAGNPNDNKQSSAGKGDKDILITYNDGDASPDSPPQQAHRPVSRMVVQHNVAAMAHGPANGHPATPQAPHASGPGIILTNKSQKEESYFFYDNYWNGNGTAGANFDHPLKSVKLAAGAATFVALPETFKGRVQRGTHIPATWAEFQISAGNDHAAHGDISVEQGCDGAATISSTDGSRRVGGFTNDVLRDAPAAACARKPDGSKALASTMGNWMGGPNHAAIDWLHKVVGQEKAYITGGTGTPDIASHNKCLAVDFY